MFSRLAGKAAYCLYIVVFDGLLSQGQGENDLDPSARLIPIPTAPFAPIISIRDSE